MSMTTYHRCRCGYGFHEQSECSDECHGLEDCEDCKAAAALTERKEMAYWRWVDDEIDRRRGK